MADLFDRLKRGLDKGVATVAVRSKEMLETTQLRSQVKTLEEERQRGVEELGSIVYTLHVQGKLDTEGARVRAKCEALAALDQRIREKEDEIRQVQARAQEALGRSASAPVGVCACGAPFSAETKFCGGCGRKTEEPLSLGSSPGQAGCGKCGTVLQPGARFCGGCGAPAEPLPPDQLDAVS